MKRLLLSGIVCLSSLFSSVAAWGPRGSPNGPPGHYGGIHKHGHDFVPDHVLHLTYGNASIGCQSRASVLINGTTPGPELRLKPGKTSWIRVYNDMTEYNATIHWHGLSQRTAPFSDGTPAGSQWPIPPLHFFDYEVHPLESESGTYFYHSHVGFQLVTASGPLVVEDAGIPPFSYDEERMMFLTDYFNRTDSSIEDGLVASPFVWSGETNAVLLNGVGVSIGEAAGHNGCSLPVINVQPDTTYRMRFVGATAISMTQLAIVGHDEFTIIAADGAYTQQHCEPYMQVSPGQRFDVLFKTKPQSEITNQTDFLIQWQTKDRPSVYNGYGVLRYANAAPQITHAPATPPITLPNATYSWAEYALQPLRPNNFPTAAEVTRRVTIDVRQILTDTDIWRLNGLQWNETSSPYPGIKPYLINIYENGPAAIPDYAVALKNSGWDPVSRTWPAKIGEVLEIIWQNTGSLVQNNGGLDYHPFHAHGGHYYDIGSGNGTYNPEANEKRLQNYTPVLRDTTNLYRYESGTTAGSLSGWRGWRLRVEDAGVFMIHCHVAQHLIMGMASMWIMGDYKQIASIPHYDAAPYLVYGGSAYGNETFAPSVAHWFGDR